MYIQLGTVMQNIGKNITAHYTYCHNFVLIDPLGYRNQMWMIEYDRGQLMRALVKKLELDKRLTKHN